MSQAIPKNMNRAEAFRNLGYAQYQLSELDENIAKLKRGREDVPSYLVRQQLALKSEIQALKDLLGEEA